MSGIRRTYLRCDHLDTSAEYQLSAASWDCGRLCPSQFRAPVSGLSLGATRREAVKAGWAYEGSQLGREFDKDYCPGHKPEEKR